jgi:retinol-binding protein 3
MLVRVLAIFVVTVSLVIPTSALAQVRIRKDQPDREVDAKSSQAVVEGIVKALDEAYIFPETAKKISEDLHSRLEKKEYEKVTSSKELADLLTNQLQTISKDKHLRVMYSYDTLPKMPQGQPDERERTAMREQMRARGASSNFGFEKIERLEGNVGYLDLRMFQPAELGGETAAAAMNFLANTDALIIDVRKNGGGAPSMVALLCSYLFGADPVHLNDLYFRPDDSTHQWWTLPYLPGKRYEGKPVYILTSNRTFSAAEEFTYNLKCLKRATVVGETTGGGAHPGGMRPLDDHFGLFVPSGRAINPITKTNWEGTGVSPDISVPADEALKTAHLSALEKLSTDLADALKGSDKKSDREKLEQAQEVIKKLKDSPDGSKIERKESGNP